MDTEYEEVALWMAERGYATGHGDTISDMLCEMEGQICERTNRSTSDMLAALKALVEIGPKAPPPAYAKIAKRNWQIFQNAAAIIRKLEGR